MDLKKEILKTHGKNQASRIARYAGASPERFRELVNIYLEGPYRITQRASWPLGVCAEQHPELLRPHLKKILDFLNEPGIHDAVKRNTMRILQFVDIPKRNHNQVMEICFHYLQQTDEPVAVKAFAMTALHRIIQGIPELERELSLILEDQLPYAKPAFRSRAVKLLTILNKTR